MGDFVSKLFLFIILESEASNININYVELCVSKFITFLSLSRP